MIAFADTYAFIAWLNPRDGAHAKVVAYLNAYSGKLLTTEWVLMELADALTSPESRTTTSAFLTAVREDPAFEIIGYSADVYRKGFELYAARHDKWWSLTDSISFAVMNERRVSDALTADHHFEQAGFQAIFK
jgi:predicted nucleic acid-binding protein